MKYPAVFVFAESHQEPRTVLIEDEEARDKFVLGYLKHLINNDETWEENIPVQGYTRRELKAIVKSGVVDDTVWEAFNEVSSGEFQELKGVTKDTYKEMLYASSLDWS